MNPFDSLSEREKEVAGAAAAGKEQQADCAGAQRDHPYESNTI